MPRSGLSDALVYRARVPVKRLKKVTQHPVELVTMAVRSLWEGKEAPHAYLERLHLADAHSFKDLFVRRLFAGNL